MALNYKISDFGLKFIKTYEGFRASATELESGQIIIGYGHALLDEEETTISRAEAENLLLHDLHMYEALVNEHVYAPISQNQFDALVSFAYNIGVSAFLSSSVLHNLNAGQIILAANGFDEWIKGRLADRIYVIDALVRRRTAEKALFLRSHPVIVPTPRYELRSYREDIDGNIEIFDHDDIVVERVPGQISEWEGSEWGSADINENDIVSQYQENKFGKRREDGPAGILTLSELVYEDNDEEDLSEETSGFDDNFSEDLQQDDDYDNSSIAISETATSPIAKAAAEVSERLDALISANDSNGDNEEETNFETDYISDNDLPARDVNKSKTSQHIESKNKIGVNNYQDNDLRKDLYPSQSENSSLSGFWVSLIAGLGLLLGGLWKMGLLGFNDTAYKELDKVSAFLAPLAVFFGALFVLGGLYYLIKSVLFEK